jgi:subtilisin-like proprotein convertase family protein
MRLKMILGVLLLLAFSATFASAATIPVTGDNSQLQLANETRGELNFRVEVGTIETMDVSTKGGDFTRLLIPGFHTSQLEGQPELPMMNRLIAVPAGARAVVSASNVQTRMVRLADFGIVNPVFPTQPSLSKSQRPEDVPFVYDMASYNRAAARELVQVIDQGRMRAMDIARLEISPVAYYPATGELEIVESFDVSVSFVGADNALSNDLIAGTYSPFFEHLYASIDGSKSFQDSYPDRVADQVTMVVVTPPAFAAQMSDFVAWKTERGFNTIVAVTGTPEVGTTTASIQAYLHGLYNAGTPEAPAPSFVLFVGDVAEMPTFTEAGDATDRPYCAVDGDLVPDMYYGRFSASNPTELQAQLDKTMMYDQYTMPDPSYLGNVTMIAGADSGYAPTHGNGQINYGTEHYFNASHGINSNTFLYPETGGAIEGQLISTYNEGVGFVNYTAHGSITSWSAPSLSQSDINSLTNNDKYFLAVGNCCLTSSYDYGECFGETFLRAEGKGAIGYIGGSNSTYWDEDYWWGVGYHASSEIDGSALPVENTGIGVYDANFHEHGEPETVWYVTQDAVVFAGNLAVMESGSTRTTYYWNIYNLLGDPSISIYMGVPEVNNVGHLETIFMGQTSLPVTAEFGSYVGLTQNGVLVGSGTVDATGSLDVEYIETLIPGTPVKMVVMAQNMEPYITDIMVIVPATVTIDPMVIPVATDSDITVTVMDAAGTTPQPGINIWAEGFGYNTAPIMTDANGVAVISVNSAYGPTLDIVGQDPADSFRLFTEQITVTAADLTAPDLTVATDIGLVDAFALNLPGTLTATLGEAGHTLFAVLPDGTVLNTADMSLVLTPAELGMVNGIIAVEGYNVYTESFEVIEAYGTISGNVTSGGTAMANVIVNGLDSFGGTVFTAVTDASGNYVVADEILVADYTIVIDHFGYLHYEENFFVNYGANVNDIAIVAAPSGILSGNVIDADTFEGLLASVKVYRTDNGELYAETLCDATGAFATAPLPYFTYDIRVRAYHHVPASVEMTIEQPETVKNFALTATNGDLLIIDDSASALVKMDKMGGKYGNLLMAPGYTSDDPKSAVQMASDLEEMGFFVSIVDAASIADAAMFYDYDMVILSCGGNTTTLANAVVKNGLVNYANEGGHILLEGGELGYDQYGSGAFATDVMHSVDWNHDSAGNIGIADASLYILNNPNPGCQPITITYSGYGDSDAMAPLADAVMPLNWSQYPTDAAMITFDSNPAPEGGQMVFLTWNYLAADMSRYALLENSVHWLLAQEFGSSSVSGQAMMLGMTDHSGIQVTAIPGGGSTLTAADGTYTLPGLYAGTYNIVASHANFATMVQEVTLTDGESLTGINFILTGTYEDEVCSSPALAINDNVTVSDVATMPTTGEISEVAVFLDITHTYLGDLDITLTSPAGTTVALHSRSGGSADDILGWYPADIEPAGDLGLYVGEEMAGDWTLTIADNAGGDTGMLNNWCVHVTYAGGTVGIMPDAMAVMAVDGGMGLNWEFNGMNVDGINVYRRTEDSSMARINEYMVPVTDGVASFTDSGMGLVNGETVFYAFAAVTGGVEQSMSQEVEAVFNSGAPTAFALHGNYPNPFNPMTSIKFDMARAGHVRLTVYDIAGRVVRTLVDEVRPAAAHEVIWDGTDTSGRRSASGTYYYQITTDGFTDTQKMMLVK